MDKELEESYKHFKNILDNASPFTMSPYTYNHLATLLNYIENSIPTQVVEKEITELKNMKVDGEVFTTSVNFAIKILQELLQEKKKEVGR